MLRQLLLLVTLVCIAPGLSGAAPILVNEFNGVAAAQFLNGGDATADVDGEPTADTYFGRIQGNGGDWLELVVIQDHLDLRGASLSIDEGNAPNRTNTVLTFTLNSLWSDLRSGTIITVAEDLVDDPTYDPLGGDWWIHVQASDTSSGAFITASNFSVSNDDTQIAIRDSLLNVLFGPAGEGVQPVSAINNREVWKLEADPSDSITPVSFYNDGSSSSFGSPNRWSGGQFVQDFSALRAVVPEPTTASLFALALLALSARRARRAA
jgi:hypothetical protein